ncbi:hypothetical protein CORT_0H01050 [Candida orthopsilosis Co 90-125]|uniref:Uncharacterized protein n=1 Tax=Candida orthopsilosis (strain 90-125) TaxID=1136231 RepID=H8XAX3_CANO9|nr:hypothetical protein CORT_0H01050 [Candida orthopsilosis Co 90-125]CCG25221.1 hypothetical protein CORT_0H01050 [Candida orthopsilosis Co 90-125]
MKLLHIHFHPGFNWTPHFIIEGYDSLDKQIELGNITRKKRLRKNTEYLSFAGCKVCEHRALFDVIKK